MKRSGLSRVLLASSVALVLVLAPLALRPQNSSPLSPKLDDALIKSTVESAAGLIHREYFDPDLAAKLDAALRQWLAEDRYANLKTPEALASALTSDLDSFSHDKHLAVTVIPSNTGPAYGGGAYGGPGASQQSRAEAVRVSNAGVQRIEILPGNVGYLNITAFFRPVEEVDAIAAALHMLRNADALILDMRDNSGGSPDTAALLASYFFDAPKLLLFEIVPRSGKIERYTTESVADQNGKRPLYVLTSAHTWSGGEGVAFILQERQRAEIIGETTVGAANPGKPYPINTTFSITIPNSHVRSAVRGTNWEGVGVVPDTAVPASDALRVAQAHALRQLLGQAPPGLRHDQLQHELAVIQAQ